MYTIRKLLVLLLFLFVSLFSYAEISTGVLLTQKNTNVDKANIEVINKDGLKIPTGSGLHLYDGDVLKSSSESIVILIPSTSLLINVSPYSEISFEVEDMGRREYVLKLILEYGSFSAETYLQTEITQILLDISTPTDIIRPDNKEDTTGSAFRIYVQIIKRDAEYQSRNIETSLDTGIFVTDETVDLPTFIKALKVNAIDSGGLKETLEYPTFTSKTEFSQRFILTSYFYNFNIMQLLLGQYELDIKKNKFSTTLTTPLFMTRNNLLYNPLGFNDLLFGSGVWSNDYDQYTYNDRFAINFDQALLSTLNKVKKLSYGRRRDVFYLYFGEQEKWHNPRSTLFAYQYTPFRATPNNFNKDLIASLNFERLGNEFRMRQFQNANYTDLTINNIDILYDRIWFKPLLPIINFELGLTFAADLALGKYSEADTDSDVQKADVSSHKLLFYAADITVPIFTTYLYSMELNTEAGMITPLSSDGVVTATSNTFSIINWGGKAGLRNIFHNKNDATHEIIFNGYFTTGFFKPHFAASGYEYTTKFNYNQAVSSMRDNPSQDSFNVYAIYPEIAYSLDAHFFNLALGTYFPIIAQSSNLHQDLGAFVKSSADFSPLLPSTLNITGNFSYTITGYDTADASFSLVIAELSSLYSGLGPVYNPVDVNLNIKLYEIFQITIGYFNTPRYSETNLSYTSITKSPSFVLMPYATFVFSPKF